MSENTTTTTVTTSQPLPPKTVGENISDAFTKVITFISSRRIQFFALVSGIMIITGALGLPGVQSAEIVSELNATVDKGVELLIVGREFAVHVVTLVGLLMIAYRTMVGLNERPITLDDHKIITVTAREVTPTALLQSAPPSSMAITINNPGTAPAEALAAKVNPSWSSVGAASAMAETIPAPKEPPSRTPI